MSKSPWTKEVPKENGFYWLKYRSKHGVTESPGLVIWSGQVKTVVVQSIWHDIWIPLDANGGSDFQYCKSGKVDKSLRFGPLIPPVETKKKVKTDDK
jgi:hypothetical protein